MIRNLGHPNKFGLRMSSRNRARSCLIYPRVPQRLLPSKNRRRKVIEMLFGKVPTEKVPSRRHFVLVYAIFVLGEVVGFVHTIITKKKKKKYNSATDTETASEQDGNGKCRLETVRFVMLSPKYPKWDIFEAGFSMKFFPFPLALTLLRLRLRLRFSSPHKLSLGFPYFGKPRPAITESA